MSWFAVADKIERTQCYERGRTGSCSCVTKRSKTHKGKNPCDYAQRMINAVAENFSGDVDIDEVFAYLKTKRCRDARCNHKHCAITDKLVEWVIDHMRTMKLAA